MATRSSKVALSAVTLTDLPQDVKSILNADAADAGRKAGLAYLARCKATRTMDAPSLFEAMLAVLTFSVAHERALIWTDKGTGERRIGSDCVLNALAWFLLNLEVNAAVIGEQKVAAIQKHVQGLRSEKSLTWGQAAWVIGLAEYIKVAKAVPPMGKFSLSE